MLDVKDANGDRRNLYINVDHERYADLFEGFAHGIREILRKLGTDLPTETT